MLVPMAKVEIIGPKSLFLDVVSALHEQGKIHIEDLSKRIASGEVALDRMEIQGDEIKVYDQLDELLIRTRAILKTLNEPEDGVDPKARVIEYERLWHLAPPELADEISSVIADVEEKTADLAALHTAAEGEVALLARYEPILGKIQPLAKQLVVTGAFDSVALLVERRYKAGLEHLQTELDKVTNSQCEILSTDIDEQTTAAIVVYARQYAEPVHKFLAMENVNQIRLPQDFQDMPLDVAYETIHQRRAELPAELDRIREELDEMSLKWFTKLTTARDVLTDRIDEIVAIPQFGRTEYAFMIDGWIPVADMPELDGMLKTQFGDEIVVSQLEIDEKDFENAPIALQNAGWAAPYQELMGFMGKPKYGTYDPTWMLAIFYPLFFGMIVGDIGYGLVMLGTVIWLRMKFKENSGVQLATAILGPAATSVIIFGFVYGEFFGNLLGPKFANVIQPIWSVNGNFGAGYPVPAGARVMLPFERTQKEMLITFLIIAIALGAFQVILGLCLGIYNGLKTKHMSHVYEKGGILAFVIGFAALVLMIVFGAVLTSNIGTTGAYVLQAIAALVLFLGFAFAIKGGGIVGAIESIGALSNIASYLRIMAVGLAGAIFAEAVNKIAASMGNPILGLIIAVPLQMLNFVICAFSPNIHAVRLNFLEFFGKFYEPGSKDYKPFQKTGGEKRA
ncbi:MAG: V-type ATPase 116kDa subunit family protein [Coriobacteriia bacterium]